MIDSFHLEAYGISAVNYNRDLEVFPILKNILYKIMGEEIYKSPTDMGVNSIGKCIVNDDVVRTAARKEIIRRYYKALVDNKVNGTDKEIYKRIKVLMNELNITKDELKVIDAANNKKDKCKRNAIALELQDGTIITGKQTKLLTPASSLILNCIKHLTNIPDEIDLLSPNILNPILRLKKQTLCDNELLNLNDVLISLSICSATNSMVKKALNNLKKLNSCDAHATYIVETSDLEALRSLLINLTCEPIFKEN